MKVNFNFLYVKLLLTLAGLVACASVMAKDLEPLATTQQNSESSALSSVRLEVPLLGQASMLWSMLPGESLNDLARLFYPKNKHMQQRFVSKTMLLSRETQPNLNPATTFTQESLIVIPDIKWLSRQGKPVRSRLHKIENTINYASNSKLQADYDGLVRRNTFFKQELEKLNIKLTQLQQKLTALKIEVMRFINRVLPVRDFNSVTESTAKLVKQKTDANLQNNQLKGGLIENRSAISTQATVPVLVPTVPPGATQTPLISQHLMMSALLLFFVTSLFFGLGLYIRRQAKIGFITVKNFANHLDISSHKINAPEIRSEFTGSLLDIDSESAETQDDKEESELALEQAKIYISLNREREAILLLQAHIQASPKAALQHWLLLLDIYRNTNQKEEFLRSARQLHQNFNVMLPQWEKTSLSTAIASSLEEFSYITEKVTKLWADCEKESKRFAQTKNYLDELLMGTRDGERTGFSMDVFQEILLLRNMLDVREKLTLTD